MTRYFTQYWTNETWRDQKDMTNDTPFIHTASNMFWERGVAVGDHIYVITVDRGALKVAGKMVVAGLGSQEDIANFLEVDLETLWPARDHAIATVCTILDFDNEIPSDVVNRLRFVKKGGEAAPVFESDGKLDRQTLRGVRELTHASALLLDEYLPPLEDITDEEDEELEA